MGAAAGDIVLVVDDDPVIAELLAAVFAASGYTIVAAHDRTAAFAVLTAAEAPVAALVCDKELPGDDGLALLRALGVRAPGATRVLMSGHSAAHLAAELASDEHVVFFQKPFRPRDLLAAIVPT